MDDLKARQNFNYRHNSSHLRDREYSSSKAENTCRILLLGDSFTHGDGVIRDEDIFAEILERRLNETDLPESIDAVEILNGGISGSLTSDWLQLWKVIRDQFVPNIVVMVFFLSRIFATRSPHSAGTTG
jgi:lysophospholipase L1-like esterase